MRKQPTKTATTSLRNYDMQRKGFLGMSTCKYPFDKTPCVVTSSAKIEDVFTNVKVSVFDQSVYGQAILVNSFIHCAVTALLTESLGFIFNGESSACLLHSYTLRYQGKGIFNFCNT